MAMKGGPWHEGVGPWGCTGVYLASAAPPAPAMITLHSPFVGALGKLEHAHRGPVGRHHGELHHRKPGTSREIADEGMRRRRRRRRREGQRGAAAGHSGHRGPGGGRGNSAVRERSVIWTRGYWRGGVRGACLDELEAFQDPEQQPSSLGGPSRSP